MIGGILRKRRGFELAAGRRSDAETGGEVKGLCVSADRR